MLAPAIARGTVPARAVSVLAMRAIAPAAMTVTAPGATRAMEVRSGAARIVHATAPDSVTIPQPASGPATTAIGRGQVPVREVSVHGTVPFLAMPSAASVRATAAIVLAATPATAVTVRVTARVVVTDLVANVPAMAVTVHGTSLATAAIAPTTVPVDATPRVAVSAGATTEAAPGPARERGATVRARVLVETTPRGVVTAPGSTATGHVGTHAKAPRGPDMGPTAFAVLIVRVATVTPRVETSVKAVIGRVDPSVRAVTAVVGTERATAAVPTATVRVTVVVRVVMRATVATVHVAVRTDVRTAHAAVPTLASSVSTVETVRSSPRSTRTSCRRCSTGRHARGSARCRSRTLITSLPISSWPAASSILIPSAPISTRR